MPPRMYMRIFSTWGSTSDGGKARKRVRSRVRTVAEMSDISGSSLVRMAEVPTGLFGGLAETWLVR